jgi:hypothetical protein
MDDCIGSSSSRRNSMEAFSASLFYKDANAIQCDVNEFFLILK